MKGKGELRIRLNTLILPGVLALAAGGPGDFFRGVNRPDCRAIPAGPASGHG